MGISLESSGRILAGRPPIYGFREKLPPSVKETKIPEAIRTQIIPLAKSLLSYPGPFVTSYAIEAIDKLGDTKTFKVTLKLLIACSNLSVVFNVKERFAKLGKSKGPELLKLLSQLGPAVAITAALVIDERGEVKGLDILGSENLEPEAHAKSLVALVENIKLAEPHPAVQLANLIRAICKQHDQIEPEADSRGHGNQGMHPTPHYESHGYVPSDWRKVAPGEAVDTKNIDWHIYARTGEVYEKVYQQTQQAKSMIVVNPLVLAGEVREAVPVLAGTVAEMSVRRNDPVGLLIGDGKNGGYFPPTLKTATENAAARLISYPGYSSNVSSLAILEQPLLRQHLPHGSTLYLISDFFQEINFEKLAGKISAWRARGINVIPIQAGADSTLNMPKYFIKIGRHRFEIQPRKETKWEAGLAFQKRINAVKLFLRQFEGIAVTSGLQVDRNAAAIQVIQEMHKPAKNRKHECNFTLTRLGEEIREIKETEPPANLPQLIEEAARDKIDLMNLLFAAKVFGWSLPFDWMEDKIQSCLIQGDPKARLCNYFEDEAAVEFVKQHGKIIPHARRTKSKIWELYDKALFAAAEIPCEDRLLSWGYSINLISRLVEMLEIRRDYHERLAGRQAIKRFSGSLKKIASSLPIKIFAGLAAAFIFIFRPFSSSSFRANASFSPNDSAAGDSADVRSKPLGTVSRPLFGKDSYLPVGLATTLNSSSNSYSTNIRLADFRQGGGERISILYAGEGEKTYETLRPAGSKFLGLRSTDKRIAEFELAGNDPENIQRLYQLLLPQAKAALSEALGKRDYTELVEPTVAIEEFDAETRQKWLLLHDSVQAMTLGQSIEAVRDFVKKEYKYKHYDAPSEWLAFRYLGLKSFLRLNSGKNEQVKFAVNHRGGVCVELSAVTLGVLRFIGAPSAIEQGYTIDGNQLIGEPHQWASVILKDTVTGKLTSRPVETAVAPALKKNDSINFRPIAGSAFKLLGVGVALLFLFKQLFSRLARTAKKISHATSRRQAVLADKKSKPLAAQWSTASDEERRRISAALEHLYYSFALRGKTFLGAPLPEILLSPEQIRRMPISSVGPLTPPEVWIAKIRESATPREIKSALEKMIAAWPKA